MDTHRRLPTAEFVAFWLAATNHRAGLGATFDDQVRRGAFGAAERQVALGLCTRDPLRDETAVRRARLWTGV